MINCILCYFVYILLDVLFVDKMLGGNFIKKTNRFFVQFLLTLLFSVVLLVSVSCDSGTKDIDVLDDEREVKDVVVVDDSLINFSSESNISGEQTTKSTADNSKVENKNTAIETPKYDDYNISVEIFPEERKISGVQKVIVYNTYTVDQDISEVYFHLDFKAFEENYPVTPYFESFKSTIFKNGMDYSVFNVMNVLVNGENADFSIVNNIMKVSFVEPVKYGGTVEIAIMFDAYIPKIAHRTGANDKAMWFGNFFPVLSVYEKSSWVNNPYYPAGDPFYSDVSNYLVEVTAPSSFIVTGTGEETSKTIGDKRITTITAKMVRSFAFVASDNYKVETIKTNSGIYINVYYYSDLVNIDKFMTSAKRSFDYFGGIVGVYPYDSFDIVETDFFIEGGMEYPQITFIDSKLLNSTEGVRVIDHEIGHQWFYGILGNNQIKESWIDEGFVSFLELGINNTSDEVREIMKKRYDDLQSEFIMSDGLYGKLATDLSEYKSWSRYYKVNYLKAGQMFYALSLEMGSEKWQEFLHSYYSTFAFKNVQSKDLVKLAEEIHGESLTSFFVSWLNESVMPDMPIYNQVTSSDEIGEDHFDITDTEDKGIDKK